MELKRFIANDVHEYLNFNVVFRPDVNFFAGLNGTGKTTALKIIISLLTPDIRQLREIKFSKAILEVEYKKELVIIECSKNNNEFKLNVIDHKNVLSSSNKDELTVELNRWRRAKNLRDSELSSVIDTISKLETPMFLSLDRRFIGSSRIEDFSDISNSQGFNSKKRISNVNSIAEAVAIISRENSIARAHQVKIDKVLRDDIIKNALSFTSPPESMTLPNKAEISNLLKKHEAIKDTLVSLDIPSENFTELYTNFLTKMERLGRKIEEKKEAELSEPALIQIISEWLTNQGQLKRIDDLFSLVEIYRERKSRIYSSLNRFEQLVNNFLNETGKSLIIGALDGPQIKVGGKNRSISILSSGESQILIMLTHLVLNRKLTKNGVFIVDEPELSLHISWQDKFVEAVQAANPELQVILATHSPAIIGGRNEMFVPLNSQGKE